MKAIWADIIYTLRYISLVVLGLVMPFCDSTFLVSFWLPSKGKVVVGKED